MTGIADREDQKLIGYWSKVLDLTEEDKEAERRNGPEGWKAMAPSEKLFLAAASLGKRKRVLDYGCGSGWAGIIAAKSGCGDVTAADAAAGAVNTARFYASLYEVEKQMKVILAAPSFLSAAPSGTYDGFFCSNVLDVVPPETAESILRESARIVTGNADVIIGLNFYLSPEAAAARGMELTKDNRLYVDGILRLVSRSDEEWAELFSPCFSVRQVEHFAWPGETVERRRLFHLRKRDEIASDR